MSRRWLVSVSIAAHLSILIGLFVSGIWRIERLDGGRARVSLTQPLMPPPPPAASSGHPAPTPPETPRKPRKIIPKEIRQIAPHLDQTPQPPTDTTVSDFWGKDGNGPADSPCVADCGEGDKAEPVCGNGALEVGEQCDDGNTADGDGCSATCRLEPRPPPPATATVAPSVLQGLRLSGDTQVHPPEVTQSQMVHDGVGRVEAIVKLCVGVDGSVTSTKLLASTRYAEYDARLLAAVRDWRYQPYMVAGRAVPACSTVRFVYTMR